MASSAAKSSRSRATVPSSSSDVICSAEQEEAGKDGGQQLSEKLKAFKSSQFDPNAFVTSKCQNMTEKDLFAKVNRMASIAADMFIGRERFTTLLFMRLIETVIVWLSNDQTFWEEIEEGPTPLGPLGLQQFYLDMEFVILFSSQGRYFSRNLHQVIKNIIERAIEAFATTGMDPYSVLPEDKWFAELSQIAINMLMNKNKFGMDRDVTSPTTSISAQSVSSVLSHGSS